MKKNLLYSTLFLFILLSCNKEMQNTDNYIKINKGMIGKQKSFAANYSFNWETATSMPVSPASLIKPAMPWQSQSGSYIDPVILTDYKSSDGWILVYNTFNNTVIPYPPTVPNGGLYFALYNIYRGLLRFYVYIPSGYINNNADIQHGLSIYSANGGTTNMLNFEGGDIVDASNNVNAITKTNNSGVAYGGGWYAMQYEIAYDPNFAKTTYPNLGLTWNSQTVSVSTIQINGTQLGTITGDITQQSSGFDWSNTLINGIIGAAEIYESGGLGTYTNNTSLTQLNAAAVSGLAGNVTGLLNGIFGGDSNNSQSVDLKMNTTISLAGTLTSSQPFIQNSLVVPGQTIANTIGSPNPLYNLPLGVLNLTNRPTVYAHTTYNNIIYRRGDGGLLSYNTQSTFTFDNSLASILVINPQLSNKSKVTLISAKLMLLPSGLYPSGISFGDPSRYSTDGTSTIIGGRSYYYNPTQITEFFTSGSGDVSSVATYTGKAYVQVVLKVAPNNGAPASTIVKTFLANVVQK